MRSVTRFVGMDVHADTIAVAVADQDGVRSIGIIPKDQSPFVAASADVINGPWKLNAEQPRHFFRLHGQSPPCQSLFLILRRRAFRPTNVA